MILCAILVPTCLPEERYEAILKVYNLPVKGDIEAKRQALRVFLSIPDEV